IDFFSGFSLSRQDELAKLKGHRKNFLIPEQENIDNHENEIRLFGMQNWGATGKDIFDCTLEEGCKNVPTCEEILNHTRYAMVDAPGELGVVYNEEVALTVARNIWFGVQ